MQRKPLKHRDYEVDLESRLGKTQVSRARLSLLLESICILVSLLEKPYLKFSFVMVHGVLVVY